MSVCCMPVVPVIMTRIPRKYIRGHARLIDHQVLPLRRNP